MALDQLKSPAPVGNSSEELLQVATPNNPEIDHLRRRHSADFKAAFETALAELTPEQRNILRLSVVDQLSIDEIGVLFGVHRATAARQLARARELVQERTWQILQSRLRLESGELRSFAGYIQSRLDLSIHRILTQDDAILRTEAAPARARSTRKKKTPKKTRKS
jgi:RNA polymerase sigma-70 factor (ECF subfamily)